MENKIKIAILDDYQDVATSLVDWSPLAEVAEITAYHDHMKSESDIVATLLPYQVICVMRERTPLPGQILEQLPNLKLIVSTAPENHSIDHVRAEQLGIDIKNTGYVPNGAPELTWALLLAAARNIPQESANIKSGKWQKTVGKDLAGKTIGIIGLGKIGKKIARYAQAFDMKVLAWSEHLTDAVAVEAGTQKVSKENLLIHSDFITIHMPLSERSKGMISTREIALMKPTSILINTSRGPLIDEDALIAALTNKTIAGAALDVFDVEPLSSDHVFRSLDNVIATPHLGFVTENTYRGFYQDTMDAIRTWINENGI